MEEERSLCLIRRILLGAVVACILPLFVFGVLDPGLLSPSKLEKIVVVSVPAVSANYESILSRASPSVADSYLKACTAILLVHFSTLAFSGVGISISGYLLRSRASEVNSLRSKIMARWNFVRQPRIAQRLVFFAVVSGLLIPLFFWGFLPNNINVAERPSRFVAGAVVELWLPSALFSISAVTLWAGLAV